MTSLSIVTWMICNVHRNKFVSQNIFFLITALEELCALLKFSKLCCHSNRFQLWELIRAVRELCITLRYRSVAP